MQLKTLRKNNTHGSYIREYVIVTKSRYEIEIMFIMLEVILTSKTPCLDDIGLKDNEVEQSCYKSLNGLSSSSLIHLISLEVG